MVAKEPGHQGEHDISRKTIAQGVPADCGVPVVANACAFCCTRGRGCTALPAFPPPSYFLRVVQTTTRALFAPRECQVAFLARHAPLQAGHPVRRDVSCKREPSLEYWIARSGRAATSE